MQNDQPRNPLGRRHKRGYLPHFDAPGFIQFITFRLDGSLPKSIYKELKFKLETKQITEIEYHRKIEIALDTGSGPLHLLNPEISRIVAEGIFYFSDKRYKLHAWVIMPNHVHILISPFEEFDLSAIMHSIKSFTGSRANKILGASGQFWSPDYFDRFIRDHSHFVSAKKYIENNPVKAGLCSKPEDWRWGNAYRED